MAESPTGSGGSSSLVIDVTLPERPPGSRWDVEIKDHEIRTVRKSSGQSLQSATESSSNLSGKGGLLAPSLCHPHVHIDKAFLLPHPRYSHLQIEEGTFDEAMELTSNAKTNFEDHDLLERGQRLVNESVEAGVTHMRAFVEVDPIVNLKCLQAGHRIREKNRSGCHIQLCAFAQLPLFTGDDGGQEIRRLMVEAMKDDFAAEAVGSTPYVEADRDKMVANVDWLIDLALDHDKHLDFHLDYNLDPKSMPLVWYVIKKLKEKEWTRRTSKTIVLGHCTRLSLFCDDEWKRLKEKIADLPISFVGLPTSDLYMMRTQNGVRGTLPVPKLIKEYGLNAAIGINNIGNAFTPQGCCDPVYLATLGVGVYSAGTQDDVGLLYECISSRAKRAIGVGDVGHAPAGKNESSSLQVREGRAADLVLFPAREAAWETNSSISDVVYFYEGSKGRTVWYQGARTSS